METSAYIALSRQSALRRELDVVAHNLANMNTTAFKSSKMMFVEHLIESEGGESFIPTKLAFARDIAQYYDTAEGPIKTTGNKLDFAVREDGYFVVAPDEEGGARGPNGASELYTRNGRFSINSDGELVTQNGFTVLSDAGTPIFFAPEDTEISVSTDGTISTNNGVLGKMRVVRFEDQQKLKGQADGMYTSEDPPQDVDRPTVIQGALEASNVQPIIELTKMIEVQRAYNSVRSFIDREDQRQKKMIQQMAPRF
ncbi:MAG: flagellar basal-body rod protein FlgF [Rhodospirillales bacterium]|jgi:flagellar basal-body rod protein FlgF|nr:flagellar basal-body rod protein FlgF [Rhodospirillales bacterium]MDP6644540.1 flagellar basal-body rod protein FlgF [Rhodospirillales bacterium]|tara:strand:+ start:1054 stop:1818 length:765 start_codon:yes stop_codon:yes gene_type:complete